MWIVGLQVQNVPLSVNVQSPGRSRCTFHGRDRMAPAAGRLAAGARPSDLGPVHTAGLRGADLVLPIVDAAGVRAQIVLVDRFGNLITNARSEHLGAPREGWSCEVAGRRLPLSNTYADVAPGEALCLLDSFDRIEVAVRDGDAAGVLGLGCGDEVRLVKDAS